MADNIHAQIGNLAFSSLAPNLHTVSQGVGARTRHLFNKTCYIFTGGEGSQASYWQDLQHPLVSLAIRKEGCVALTLTGALLLDLIAIIPPSLLIAHCFRTLVAQ